MVDHIISLKVIDGITFFSFPLKLFLEFLDTKSSASHTVLTLDLALRLACLIGYFISSNMPQTSEPEGENNVAVEVAAELAVHAFPSFSLQHRTWHT